MIKLMLTLSLANAFWGYRTFRECADDVTRKYGRERILERCAKYIRTDDDECEAARLFDPAQSHLYCAPVIPGPQCDAPVCD